VKSDSAYNLPMAQPVQTFRLGPKGVERMELPAATLAQASLQLPQGTYTTLRTYEGEKFLRLEAHLSRLEESSRLLGRPIRLDRDCIRCALREVLACFAVKEGVLHTAGEGVLERITRSIVLEEAARRPSSPAPPARWCPWSPLMGSPSVGGSPGPSRGICSTGTASGSARRLHRRSPSATPEILIFL